MMETPSLCKEIFPAESMQVSVKPWLAGRLSRLGMQVAAMPGSPSPGLHCWGDWFSAQDGRGRLSALARVQPQGLLSVEHPQLRRCFTREHQGQGRRRAVGLPAPEQLPAPLKLIIHSKDHRLMTSIVFLFLRLID